LSRTLDSPKVSIKIKMMWEIFKELEGDFFLLRTQFFVPDRPGSLASLAELFAKRKINIVYFYYNRSEHPNKVIIEAKSEDLEQFKSLYEETKTLGFLEEYFDEVFEITSPENIYKLSVYLEHKPGTLYRIANLLKAYEANVIYMIYNELLSENKANIAIYVKDSHQINNLLNNLNTLGYHYYVEYTGDQQDDTNKLIGLTLLERFYLKLRNFLSDEEITRIKEIINISKELSDTLIKFNKKAGENLEAGSIFANILTFAISSRTKIKENFYYKKLPSLPYGNFILHTFKFPTGANLYLFELDDEYVIIDGSYGIYYEDLKRVLRENKLLPEKVKRIYLTHPDADHAGLSGYFEEEFGTEVYLHPEAIPVIEKENRVYGVKTPLYELNKYFTRLVNYFTKAKFPKKPKTFRTQKLGNIGVFPVIDSFEIGDHTFKVLESLGGHVPGQVFFLCETLGLIFTADYLLYIPSLSEEEKKLLNIPKYLMRSTNADSKRFREEMEQLRSLCLQLDEELRKDGKGLMIFPGHGDFYPSRFLLSQGF